MTAPRPGDHRTGTRFTRRGWWSLPALVPSFALSFAVGEGIGSALTTRAAATNRLRGGSPDRGRPLGRQCWPESDRVNCATHSTWCVIGKRSNARSAVRR